MGGLRFIHFVILLGVSEKLEGRQWWDSDDNIFPKNYALKDGATFDYIVVGAGAAGSAAAARLSLLGHDVLLVEAGGNPPAAVKIPLGVTSLIGSKYDWNHGTISNNKSCLSTMGFFNRGKCLGGSTSINHMLYTRGNRQDFEYGLPGWTWNDIKPYFLRHEGLESFDRLPESSRQFHNTSGLVKLSFMDNTKSPWHPKIINGYRQLNFPINNDVNGLNQIGVGIIPGYVHNGERMSTARAYLTEDDVKRNLKVVKHTVCAGVIVENNTAIGVKLIRNKEKLHVYSRKEIILSAGAIGTPKILMLSGIGPAKLLENQGIPLKSELPVGDTMIDHFFSPIFVLVDKSNGIMSALAAVASAISDVTKYVADRKGPLSSIGLVDIGVFANTNCYNSKTKNFDQGPGCDVPNLQILHVYSYRFILTVAKTHLQRIAYFPHITEQLAAANTEYGIIIITPLILTPYSRGNIRLASRDPTENPEIRPNFLDDERDVDQNLQAITIIEDLLETPVFRNNSAKILKLKLDCPDYDHDRKAYWKCYTRHLTCSGLHAVGTAALGTVLDERLRVRNISRLRVADLSALPKIPKGSTEAVAIALGERVVDFIREDSTDST